MKRGTLFTEGVVVAVAALIGFRLGLTPIKDNSGLTHLATGIEMVAKSWLPAIPRVDRYTYSALGHDWVVQSWLASWIVGVAERLFGTHAVLFLSGATTALVAGLMASLARTGSAARTALAVGLPFVIAAQFWAPRPLMIGLIWFALSILVVERGWPSWWLVPIGWLWVQSHGSFPLGVVFLGALWLGTIASKRDWRAGPKEFRALCALVAGVLAGALNPLGPKLVLFPLTAISKRDVFSHIVEWKPLSFDSRPTTIAILGITIAAVVCIRRRIPLRVAVPLFVFVLLAVQARRNAVLLAIVIAWALGHALRVKRSEDSTPQRLDPVVGIAVTALACMFAFLSVGEPAINTVPYPVASIRWAEQHGRYTAPHRVLSKDWVGNFTELRHGPSGDVFIDDRYDMFPNDVSLAYFDLRHNRPNATQILDRFDVDTVIWPSNDGLVARLRRAGWTVGFTQKLGEDWVVLIRSEA